MYGSNWVLNLKLNPTHGVGWDHMCVRERDGVDARTLMVGSVESSRT